MRLLSVALIIPFLVVGLLFHPGRTDEDGGHTDSSTGEYHYHHGFPAHQHPDGKCPYEGQEPIYTHHDNYSSPSPSSHTNEPTTTPFASPAIASETAVTKNMPSTRKLSCNDPLPWWGIPLFVFGLPVSLVVIIYLWGKISDFVDYLKKKKADRNKQ